MNSSHPLDRPAWSALTGRQAHLALGDALALRFAPDYGLFAAARDDTPASQAAMAALCPRDGALGLVEVGERPAPPGMAVIDRGVCWQMTARSLNARGPDFAIAELTDADAPEMLDLATLTKPGPFFARTHEMGAFVGVKQDGVLVAMAGERMRLDGFTEVSGVCVHPGHRGRGYSAGLTGLVATRILARGETPFLHVYDHNAPAIRVYETLGFELRRIVDLTVLAWA